jgi:transposase
MYEASGRRLKLRQPDRSQLRLATIDLDRALPADDQVRSVWAFVEGLDLSRFYDRFVTEEGSPGRAAIDPKILLALWTQATLDGVGSARELARLCEYDLRYQWICGGVIPNHHTLSDFRSLSAAAFDQVLTDSVAVMMTEGLVEMNRVAQDGMRIRASAGAASFRRRERLEEMQKIAQEQVEVLRAELEEDGGAGKRRQAAARERAAKDRAERVNRALEEMPKAEERKESNNGKKKTPARVSTTDSEATVMKMANGGFRPAYNVQFATDTVSRCIVGVQLTSEGTDLRMMLPMMDHLENHYDTLPAEWLVDGGYVNLDAIDKAHQDGCLVYAPPKAARGGKYEPTDVRPTDTEAVAEWRKRMKSEDGQRIYKQRGATAELANAHVRNRGLYQFLVRGAERVRSVALLHAIVHNFRRSLTLQTASVAV